MTSQPPCKGGQDWNTHTKSSLLSIGSHSLFISISGPLRRSGDPVAIFFTGSGDSTASYPAVERLLSAFVRIILYDRSGLGRSEDGPGPSTAIGAARELSSLLKIAGISPPFVLVAHSYGGMVAREFLHLHEADVAGMVLLDSSTERVYQHFPIPNPIIAALLGTLNFAVVTGLRTEAKISREEWKIRSAEIQRGLNTAQGEAAALEMNSRALAEKQQFDLRVMGSRPVTVVRCDIVGEYQKLYDEGIKAGNGTEDERKGFRDFLNRVESVDEELKREQMRLSSRSRYVYVSGCGHNIQLIRPDIVAEEVALVLSNCQRIARI